MYSQNDEELHIINYFKDYKGIFLDIGGFNPFTFSNTRRLYELGWSGIYIEPSPICFQSFINEYKNEPNITLVNKAVVTDDRKHITFYESGGDAVSSTKEEHKKKWEASGSKFNTIEVETINVKEIETQFPNIDFLSIDVESTNLEIFNAFSDVYLQNVKCICIEHDGHFLHISKRLTELGFNNLHINPENVILVKTK